MKKNCLPGEHPAIFRIYDNEKVVSRESDQTRTAKLISIEKAVDFPLKNFLMNGLLWMKVTVLENSEAFVPGGVHRDTG